MNAQTAISSQWRTALRKVARRASCRLRISSFSEIAFTASASDTTTVSPSNVLTGVVSASDIKNYITGSGEKADIALVPVNVASLLIGDGAEYKAVATVTHGNLYLLSLDQTTVNKENVDILKGKMKLVNNIANKEVNYPIFN